MTTAVAPTGPKSLFAGMNQLKKDTGESGGLTKLQTSNQGGSYLNFYTSSTGKTDPSKQAALRQALPGIAEATPYFYDTDAGKLVRIDNLRIIVLDAYQAWVKSDQKYTPLAAVESDPNDRDYREWIEALMLVFVGDRLIPMQGTFRMGATGAIAAASKEVAKAATPEWAKQTADHAMAARIPLVEARVVTQVSSFMKPTKSGNTAMNTRGTCRPPTAGEIAILESAFSNPEFVSNKVQTVRDAFEARKTKIKSVLAK